MGYANLKPEQANVFFKLMEGALPPALHDYNDESRL
jgi:hypothetical protein